jgi:hypothetical protein
MDGKRERLMNDYKHDHDDNDYDDIGDDDDDDIHDDDIHDDESVVVDGWTTL